MHQRHYPWLPLLLCLLLTVSAGPLHADEDGEWQDVGPSSAPAAEDAARETRDVPEQDEKLKDVKCVVTGLPWLESSTRVEAIFKVDGQRLRGKFLSMAYMLIQYKLLQEEGHSVSVETVSVLDFASFGSGSERMIPVNEDWNNIVFISTATELKGSKEPYYAAFSAVEDIEAALKTLPGKVLSYEAVMKRLLTALRSDETEDAVVEDEAASMRRQFKGFNPTSDL